MSMTDAQDRPVDVARRDGRLAAAQALLDRGRRAATLRHRVHAIVDRLAGEDLPLRDGGARLRHGPATATARAREAEDDVRRRAVLRRGDAVTSGGNLVLVYERARADAQEVLVGEGPRRSVALGRPPHGHRAYPRRDVVARPASINT